MSSDIASWSHFCDQNVTSGTGRTHESDHGLKRIDINLVSRRGHIGIHRRYRALRAHIMADMQRAHGFAERTNSCGFTGGGWRCR